jgi:hypothetical protein
MTKRGEEIPLVIGQGGPLDGRRWQINKNLVIGRDGTCDIVIPDRQISRFHANIAPSKQGPIVTDLGSKNGTFINGQKVEDTRLLQDGDVVQIALFQYFVYLSSEATVPLDAELLPNKKQFTQRLYFDHRSRRVWIGQVEILPALSAAQYRLLQMIYDREGEVVSREELISSVWGKGVLAGVSDQAFDALVRRLRKRLSDLDPDHCYISTVRGYGIKFENRPG